MKAINLSNINNINNFRLIELNCFKLNIKAKILSKIDVKLINLLPAGEVAFAIIKQINIKYAH